MRWTYILIITWVIASLYLWSLPDAEIQAFGETFAYSTNNVLEGKFWTPITSIFLHASIWHLLMNAVAFLFFGLAIEHELGYRKLLFIFFVGALAGDVLSSVFYPFDALSIGASGGVSAVLGAAMLITPFKFSMAPFIAPAPILLVGIIYLLTNLLGLFAGIEGSISYAAHVGGLVFGLGYGFKKVGKRKGLKLIMIGILLYILLAIAYSLITRAL